MKINNFGAFSNFVMRRFVLTIEYRINIKVLKKAVYKIRLKQKNIGD